MGQKDNKHDKRYAAVNLNLPDSELEAKIDAMLDPNLPDKPVEPPVVRISDTPQVVEDVPPLDIFKDTKAPSELAADSGGGAPGDTEANPVEDTAPLLQPDQLKKQAAKPESKKTPLAKEKPDPKSAAKQAKKPKAQPKPVDKAGQAADTDTSRSKAEHHNKFGLYAAAVAAILVMVVISIVVWPDSRGYLFELLNL